MEAKQKNRIFFASIIMLLIIYLVGIVGIYTSYRDLFLKLTPFNLIISLFLLFLNHKQFNTSFYFFCVITFLFGFLIEVLGVKTGIVFGEYSYGKTLGLKIGDVPLVIGLNWLMLVYSAGSICSQLQKNIFIKTLLASAMLVVLDIFIEPVAIKYDFWTWRNTKVPIQNYFAWFVLSFILLLFFNKINFNKLNGFAKYLFGIQLLFFILLSFVN